MSPLLFAQLADGTTLRTQPLTTSGPPRPLYRYVTLHLDSEGYATVVARYATWAAARQGHAQWLRRLCQAD